MSREDDPGFFKVHYVDPQSRPWLVGPPPVWKAACGYLVQFPEERAAEMDLLTCWLCTERIA